VRTGRALVSAALMAVALCAALGCFPRDRPDVEEWRRVWARTRALVPPPEAFEESDARSSCNALLVGVRAAHDSLLPTPFRVLDAPVRTWIERAEGLGAECPGARGDGEAHRSAVEDLHMLEAQIDAGLRSGAAS
jgi:hypothetical protein